MIDYIPTACVDAGYRNKGVNLGDLPPPSTHDNPRRLHQQFQQRWDAALPAARDRNRQRTLLPVLHSMFWKPFYAVGLLMVARTVRRVDPATQKRL